MKTLIRLENKDYFIVTRKLKTSSNYTVGVHLYEDDVKPRNLLCGTSFKNTSTLKEHSEWAINNIKRYYNETTNN